QTCALPIFIFLIFRCIFSGKDCAFIMSCVRHSSLIRERCERRVHEELWQGWFGRSRQRQCGLRWSVGRQGWFVRRWHRRARQVGLQAISIVSVPLVASRCQRNFHLQCFFCTLYVCISRLTCFV